MRSACVLFVALAGCIIVTDETPDDGTSDGADGGPASTASLTTASSTPDSGPDPDTSGDDFPPLDETDADDATDDDSDTDGGLRGCEGNVLSDPGFEGGTPSDVWDEGSDVFGTPLCDAGCSEDPGAAPHAGDWWVWFGGVEEPDTAFVSQSFSVDAGSAALGFWFAVNAGAGTGGDVFTATIDGETVYMATDFDVDTLEDYTLIVVDISAWADGAEHELAFQSTITGEGLTNFFVDEVTIAPCDEPVGTTDGGSSGGSSTSTGSGSTDGATGSSTGGSTTVGTSTGSSGGSSSTT